MKKILTAALACCIAVSALCFGVNAQGKNYLKSEWTNGLDAQVTKGTDNVYKATNLKNQWSSPFLSALDSIKDAVSKEESIIVTFKIRAVYTDGNDGEYTSARVLFRGTTPEKIDSKDPAASEEWNAKYEESLDGENAVFQCASGNVMFYGSKIEFTDSEWTTVEWAMDLTKAQLESPMVTGWNLCIDTVTDNTLLSAIEIKDTGVFCQSDFESDIPATPTPEPTPTPDADATPTPTMKTMFGSDATPTATATESATAIAEATEAPTTEKSGNSLWWVWVIIAVVVVAGGGAAAYFLVIKKKKDNKAE